MNEGRNIYEHFKTIPDPRIERGKKYLLEDIIFIWSSRNGISLGQVKVDEKSNEITAIPDLLSLINVKKSVVSIDAMGCQKKIVEKIIEQKGGYAIALKGNQPTLHKEVVNYFEMQMISEFLGVNVSYSKKEEKGHGRIEKREYWLLTDIDWISQKEEWKGLKSVGMVRSEREYQGKKSIESRYFISSLTDPDLFEKSIRTHWQIENSCHWVLDVVFREDDSRIRAGHAAGWDDKYRNKIIGF